MRTILFSLAIVLTSTLHAATFEVSNENDSGAGSLRAAIELANATPGRDRITFTRDARTFRPLSPLPAITDSVDVVNLGTLTIDGKNAGASDGLVIAASNITLKDIAIMNFTGDGFVISGNANMLLGAQALRNHNGFRIDGNRNEIYGASVGAGAIGTSGPGNRGIGIWITAGASGNLIGREPKPCPLQCTPYSVNVIASNDDAGIRVDGDGNTIDSNEVVAQRRDGIVVNGASNRLLNNDTDANDGNGITLRAPAELTNNIGSCNGRLFVDANGDGATPNDIPDTDKVVNTPRIDGALDRGAEIAISGALDAQPDAQYRIDFISLPIVCNASGEFPIGATQVTTDHGGLALFDVVLPKGPHTGEWPPRVGATATRLTPSPSQPFSMSELSPLVIANGDVYDRSELDVRIHTVPLSMTWDIPQIFEIVATNNGPSSIENFSIDVPHVPLAKYDNGTTTIGTCSIASSDNGGCTIGHFPAGATVVIHSSVTLPASAGFSLFTFTVQAHTPRDAPRLPNVFSLRVPVYAHARARSARH